MSRITCKGIHCPAKEQDPIEQARKSGTRKDIMEVPNGMENQDFASITEILEAVGEVERGMQS